MISSVLAGDWTGLEDQFDIQENAEQSNRWKTTLTPHPNSAVTTQVAEIVASGDIFVQNVTIEKPSSDRDVITFDDQLVGENPLPDEFAKLFADRTGE